ncbi:MAG: hypothetical protein JW913_02755 [Chitinispirillaceae bacterium]|nr:hypothetical protein [Chitinispirillaceae bacterium]
MKPSDKKALIVYNLFPRFFPTVDDWAAELPRIAGMGFNAVFVNSFFETGFSGSLYAVKDYYRLNPLFLAKGADPSDFSPLDRFNNACGKYGIDLFIDLVINHTAFDAMLTKLHPEWYKHDAEGRLVSPFAIDPADETKVTVWEDLASIDNEKSQDRDALWAYWDELVAFFQGKGIHGFRCDAAYQVPVGLWGKLISAAKRRDKRATFLAETLGCRLEQIEALAPAGFDYLFNSVKWWNYDQPWAIEQHTANQIIAPSISFPESHDTERLASVAPETEPVQKSRYAFAALFSKGVLLPMGYEYGAKTRMDVVRGRPDDVDPPQWDLCKWIGRVNSLKGELPLLSEEGSWCTITPYTHPYLFLKKTSDDGRMSVYAGVNKSAADETVIEEWMVPEEIKKCSQVMSFLNDEPVWEPVPLAFTLDPADVVLFLP